MGTYIEGGIIQVSRTRETVEEILEYPIEALPMRSISKAACQYFGIRVALDEEDGETIKAIYFPYYLEGKVTGFKKKDLTVAKGDKFHFSTVGSVSSKNDLFGKNKLATGGKKIFTVEGELDVAAVWDACKAKHSEHNPNVVGIGGTSWASIQVGNSLKMYQNFTQNIFLFDQDQATPEEAKKGVKKGREALQDVAKLIPNLMVATISENDPNDMIKKGKGEELYWALMAKAKPYIPTTLVEGSVGLERLMRPLEHGVKIDFMPKLMEKMKGLRRGEMTIILAGSGTGKSHPAGTKVIMFDGSVKDVADVIEGDKLMGPDSKSRTVLNTHVDFGGIYKVTPVKGEPWECNAPHVLSLKCGKKTKTNEVGDIVNIPLEEYLSKSKTFKHTHKLWRTGVEYSAKEVFDPYIIGLYLADGCKNYSRLHGGINKEPCLEYVESKVDVGAKRFERGCWSYGLLGFNEIRTSLISTDGERYIPKDYLINSRENRLQLLAGLLDGDGSLDYNSFDLICKDVAFGKQILQLARSLGFAAYGKSCVKSIKSTGFKGEYFRVSISGHTNEIPTKALNKKAQTRRQVKNVLVTGFDVNYDREDNYYGIALDGDHLYLLEDFTVTHNTTISKEMGYALNKAGESIFHIFVEEDLEKTQQSYIALDNNVPLPKLRENPNVLPLDSWEKSNLELIDNGRTLWIDHFGSINPETLMADIRWADANGYKYVILDHISMVFSGLDTKNERKDIDLLLTELAAFTKGANIHPIVISHVKRVPKILKKDKSGSVEYPYWDRIAMDAARGSAIFEQTAWNIIVLEAEVLESGERGRVRAGLVKNREWSLLGTCDVMTMDRKTGRMIPAEDPPATF